MPDIICPLFDLPDGRELREKLAGEGITLRAARPWERTPIAAFVREQWGQGWADEVLPAFGRSPVTLQIALLGSKLIGFAAYEVTAPGFFGPTGVAEEYQRRGVGRALLLASLQGLKDLGYVYGFIGDPGPVAFYQRAVRCLMLPVDWPNLYTGVRPIERP